MSTGAKVALVGGAATLALVLAGGAVVALNQGGEALAEGAEVFTGSGNELIELDEPHSDPYLATVEANDVVTIELRDAEGTQVGNIGGRLYGNSTAPYSYQTSHAEVAQLDVRSDADSWTITTEPLDNAESWDDPDEPLEGKGDEVFFVDWDNDGVEVEVEHSGDSNFVIWCYDQQDGYTDMLVNEIGEYSATETLLENTTLLHVTADGDWSLTPV